jgi:hypothetical protein
MHRYVNKKQSCTYEHARVHACTHACGHTGTSQNSHAMSELIFRYFATGFQKQKVESDVRNTMTKYSGSPIQNDRFGTPFSWLSIQSRMVPPKRIHTQHTNTNARRYLHTQTHRHTHRHTHTTHTHTHAHAHTHTQAQTHIHTHTHTHMNRQAQTQTHTDTDTDTP